MTSSEASEIELVNMFKDFAQQLFGYNPANIPTGLISTSIQAICERFPGITLNDIQQAFRTQEIEKKGFTALSRDEFLEPIKKYWNQKCLVVSELKKIEQQEKEEADEKQRAADFLQRAKDKYRESLYAQKWLGDHFEAISLAREFAERMKQDLKSKLWQSAGEKWKADKKAQRAQIVQGEESGKPLQGLVPVPPAENYYAMEIMAEAVKRKMLIISQ